MWGLGFRVWGLGFRDSTGFALSSQVDSRIQPQGPIA